MMMMTMMTQFMVDSFADIHCDCSLDRRMW